MKITVINPTITQAWADTGWHTFSKAALPGTTIDSVSLDWGTASVEARFDDALAAPGILMRAMEAEKGGSAAVIINCMNDPGLEAAREAISIPVIGPAQTCMHLAAMLAHRFSIITTGSTDIPIVEDLVDRYGMQSKFASVRAIEIPVLSLGASSETTLQNVIQVAGAAVLQDGAGVIIPGCTLLTELIPDIREGLHRQGIDVPVLNPPLAALKLAESLVSSGLTHSRRTYAAPGKKKIVWPAPL